VRVLLLPDAQQLLLLLLLQQQAVQICLAQLQGSWEVLVDRRAASIPGLPA
jgi:hypothetical protein